MTSPPIPVAEIEALLAAVVGGADDPVGLAVDNVIRLANPALVALFGGSRPEDLVGRTFLDLMLPEDRPRVLEYVKLRAQRKPVPGLYTPRFLRGDGSSFTAEIRTTTFHLHDQAYTLALVRDLSQDRRSAAELYEAIFARNTAVKLLIDPVDGQIVDANGAAVAFYGWSVDALRQKRISEINTLTPEEVAAELDAASEGRRSYFRFRHRVASGEIRHVDVHTGPVEVAGRKLLLSIVQDTTERDALEEQLRHAQKLDAVGRLAGGVAHDFNNLLTIILTSAELLGEELPASGRARQLLNDLSGAGRRAIELTERLLVVGQRQNLVTQRVDLAVVVRGMARLLTTAIGPDITLSFDLAENQCAEADRGQLDRVLTNLVLNAAQAIDGVGAIKLMVPDGVGDSPVALIVTDDGHGMDDATQSRVFEPFFTTRPVGKGTGLGLATTYAIVTQLGGTIDVRSAPGHGSTFTVQLPRSVHPSAVTAPKPQGQPMVLLVEDEAGLVDLFSQGLKASGFRVLAHRSGVTASLVTDDELAAVDVLVTDQTMPGLSGVELACSLRARRSTLPIVVISGNLQPRDRARLPPGAGVLAKPFSREALADAIRRVLPPSEPDQ